MLDLVHEKRFLKDLKLCAKQQRNMQIFEDIVELLRTQQPLPKRHRNHKLHGNYSDC